MSNINTPIIQTTTANQIHYTLLYEFMWFVWLPSFIPSIIPRMSTQRAFHHFLWKIFHRRIPRWRMSIMLYKHLGIQILLCWHRDDRVTGDLFFIYHSKEIVLLSLPLPLPLSPFFPSLFLSLSLARSSRSPASLIHSSMVSLIQVSLIHGVIFNMFIFLSKADINH